MSLKAGFAQVDITPPLGTQKVGWLKVIIGDKVLDPLYARVAIFESGTERVAVVQLDTGGIEQKEVQIIREKVAQQYDFPGRNMMFAATHNHAGPAVYSSGDVVKDEAYTRDQVGKIVNLVGEALESVQEAELGSGSCFEFGVSHSRRVVMRDGTVQTHGSFQNPNALFLENPIDPEVGVVAARDKNGNLLGALVNFACHPTHHGGETTFSAGYPGVLAQEMKRKGCPVTLFLNGAGGNIHTADPRFGGRNRSKEEVGRTLAQDAAQVIQSMRFHSTVPVASASQVVDLTYRRPSKEEFNGTGPRTQRFIDPKIYDRFIPRVLREIEQVGGFKPIEIQAFFLGEYALVAIPGELFVEFGLQIKQETHPYHTLVIGYANGRVSYIPTEQAFRRGGYETTFPGSKFIPQTGTQMVNAAIRLVKDHQPKPMEVA